MFNFKDFVPKQISPGGFFSNASYESLEQAIKESNQWVDQNDIDVINIETVVLPNIHANDEDGSTDTSLWQGGESSATWHQFIRIWYKV